jgi:hypothetical protein
MRVGQFVLKPDQEQIARLETFEALYGAVASLVSVDRPGGPARFVMEDGTVVGVDIRAAMKEPDGALCFQGFLHGTDTVVKGAVIPPRYVGWLHRNPESSFLNGTGSW